MYEGGTFAECFDIEVTSNDKKLSLKVRTSINYAEELLSSPLHSVDLNAKFSEMSLQEKQLCVDAENF